MLYHVGLSTSASLYDNLRYDTLNDFDPIGRITDVPMTSRQNTWRPRTSPS